MLPSLVLLAACSLVPGVVNVAAAEPAPAPTLVATELRGASSAAIVSPRGLNQNGEVAGLMTAPSHISEAAVWKATFWRSLGIGEAAAINNSGQSAGFLSDGVVLHATEWDRQGRAHDLGTLPGGVWSQANAINEQGSVAGYGQVGASTHAFIWRESKGMQDLGTLGAGNSYGFAINSVGQVAGASDGRAVVWDARQRIHELGVGENSIAYALNDAGVVVGNVAGYAFAWQPGRGAARLELPAGASASTAVGINAHGVIVGSATLLDASGVSQRAVMWRDGRMFDLNTLIDSSHWKLTSATAINDRDQIVGTGLLDGQPRPFLLTPARAMHTGG
jgi:probable HAF family extracellular repeat protein